MTVTVQNPSIEYQGDGVTTLFTFNFRLLQDTDLKVFIDTVQQVLFSNYTIQNLTEAGGEVHFNIPPADQTKVLLIRATSKTQQIDYEPFTPFPAESNEFGLDKLTMITQELEQRFIENVQPQVFSFNGRVGDIVPDITDYSQFYANLDDYNSHVANVSNPHAVQHSQTTGQTVDDHHNQVHNLFGTDHADINPIPAPVVGAALVYTNIVPAKPWEALNVYTISAYGGVFQSTATALPDMIIGWTTLLADSGTFVTPRGITQEPINNGIRFDEAGVFSVQISLTLTHDESNQSRQTLIRLFNVTKGTGGPTTVIGIGRNQSVTNYSFSLPAEITASDIGDLWKAEMGSGDPIQDIIEVSYQFWTNGIGEYRG